MHSGRTLSAPPIHCSNFQSLNSTFSTRIKSYCQRPAASALQLALKLVRIRFLQCRHACMFFWLHDSVLFARKCDGSSDIARLAMVFQSPFFQALVPASCFFVMAISLHGLSLLYCANIAPNQLLCQCSTYSSASAYSLCMPSLCYWPGFLWLSAGYPGLRNGFPNSCIDGRSVART